MACPTTADTAYTNPYDAFSAALIEQASAARIPVNAGMEITFRCNLACVMCYCNEPANDRKLRARELTTEEIRRILDQMAEAGVLWLQITGGEPLLRPDFADIYRHAKARGMLIRLFTNGTLVTPKIADLLAESPPFSIEITLYGRSEETYERVTQVKGSYRRCLRGIGLLLDRNLPLSLKTVAITLNRDEVLEMQAFARSLGVRFRYDAEINPRLDGDQAPLRYRLSPEETVRLEAGDPKRRADLQEEFARAERPRTGTQPLFGCAAGETVFQIDPYGHMTVCVLSRASGFDLRAGTVAEGWESFAPARGRTREAAPGGEAHDHCAGWAALEHGASEAVINHAAEVAALRRRVFGPGRAPDAVAKLGRRLALPMVKG